MILSSLCRDITGQKFNRLIAIKPVGKDTKRNVLWEFKCDCGNFTVKPIYNVVRNNTKSCGCAFKDSVLKRKPTLKLGQSALNHLYSNYKKRAEKKKISFSLTLEEFKIITQSNCYYCSKIPKQRYSLKNKNNFYLYNGVDRVDNNEGYVKNNCKPCCAICNKAKGILSEEEFKLWIKDVYQTIYK